MKKEDYLKMLDSLLDDYDAFYISNKYCSGNLKGNTHEYEFSNLYQLFDNNLVGNKAINWILHCYDCYYKEEVKEDKDSAFAYLRNEIEKMFP